MDLYALILFLFIYFVRPHDWIAALNGMQIVRPIMLLVALGLLRRHGGIRIEAFFRTPLDWVMLIYWLWIIYASPSLLHGILEGSSLFGFYFLTANILTSLHRISQFLLVWTVCIVALGAMGTVTALGWDFTDAQSLIDFTYHGRLIVNTWLANNPNALAHTVIIALPLLYFLLIYRRPRRHWILFLLLALIVGYCAYNTQSKGAFIVGFVTLTLTFIQGRSRTFQLCAIVLAITLGWGITTRLPRMEELSSLQTNEAVIGRMIAWQKARNAMHENFFGAGWKAFEAEYFWEGEMKTIATHGSYVKLGADLGRGGLYLYLLLLVICFRQIFSYRYTSALEDRIGKMLFTLLCTLTLSNWMVDRAYHVEFFLICGACSAFHRIMHDKWQYFFGLQLPQHRPVFWSEEIFQPTPLYSAPDSALLSLKADREGSTEVIQLPIPSSVPTEERPQAMAMMYEVANSASANPTKLWKSRSVLWIDLTLAFCALLVVFWFWDYMIRTIL